MTHENKDELDVKPIFSNNDNIPKTLEPILEHIFNEFIPMMQEMIPPLKELKEKSKFYSPHSSNGVIENSVNKTLPRMLRDIEFPIKGEGELYSTYKKATLTFNLYKMQLGLDEYKKMNAPDQQAVEQYLKQFGKKDYSKEILKMDIPRLDRVNVRVKFA